MAKYTINQLQIGQTASKKSVVDAKAIQLFGDVSGDFNPVHFDESFAQTTPFKGRIAHGMLSASFFSAILGTQLPGEGSIYLGQTLRFKAPVRINDEVEARVEVIAINTEKNRATLKTTAWVGETLVIEGEAEVMLAKG